MKFRLWHVILSKIANMSLGQKNLKSCQMKELEKNLSLPLAFSILVNIKPYQKFTKNTWNAVFNFCPPKFGALPILQECPQSTRRKFIISSNHQHHQHHHHDHSHHQVEEEQEDLVCGLKVGWLCHHPHLEGEEEQEMRGCVGWKWRVV